MACIQPPTGALNHLEFFSSNSFLSLQNPSRVLAFTPYVQANFFPILFSVLSPLFALNYDSHLTDRPFIPLPDTSEIFLFPFYPDFAEVPLISMQFPFAKKSPDSPFHHLKTHI